MPRTIWSRLFGRERDFDPPQIFDLFQETEPRHSGIVADFHNRIRQTRDDPTTVAADPRPVAAAPAAPVFSIADRIDAATAFGFTVRPAPVETVFTAVVRPVTVATPAPEATTAPVTADIAEDASARSGQVIFAPMTQLQYGGAPLSPFESHSLTNYVVEYAEDFSSALVYDAVTKQLLTGGPGDWPELAAGPDDTFELGGDFSAGFGFPIQLAGIENVVLLGGNDYNIVANDNDVAAGETLTVNAMPLRDDNYAMFDGSAETDGSYHFFGSESADFFFGGAGDDRLDGRGGGDSLTGGGGSDIFVYTGARDSSGTDYDTIADFDPAADRIDLPSAVTGFGAAIEGGALSHATFNDDLAAVLGGLGAGQAVWFAPDAGDLAGQVFLIVDGNGQPGYQDGEDYVIAVAGAPLADLTGHTDIFL